MKATNKNDIKEVSKLLRTCKDMDLSTLDHAIGNSLYCAAEKGYVNILQYMLDNYADVNFEYSDENRNVSRETPLIAAAKNGLTETVRVLINHGDKNYQVKNHSLYHLDNELFVLAENFLRSRAPKRLKADVNKTDSKGYTPLMLAAKNNHIDIVRILLIHSADVDKSLGYTALMLASKYGYSKVADILIKESADIDKSNYQGYTALLLASRYRHTEIAEMLIYQ